MSEKMNPLVKLVGTFLVLPFLVLHGVKELKRLVIVLKSHDYPVCRDCVRRERQTGYCHFIQQFMSEHDYCSRWEEKP